MKRMKTFCKYALWIIAFFIFSTIGSDLLIQKSYKPVSNENIHIEKSTDGFEITVERADSNKRQGYFIGTVKNTSKHVIEKKYVKVDSFYKGKLMQEKYLAFENLQPGEERKFKLLYKVGQIDEFRVSYVDEIPVNRTIIDKGIDKVIEYFDKAKKKLKELDAPDIKSGTLPGFVPVKVEGSDQLSDKANDALLFATVLWIWYAIPSGAIWFII